MHRTGDEPVSELIILLGLGLQPASEAEENGIWAGTALRGEGATMIHLPQEEQGHAALTVRHFRRGEVAMLADPRSEIPLNL